MPNLSIANQRRRRCRPGQGRRRQGLSLSNSFNTLEPQMRRDGSPRVVGGIRGEMEDLKKRKEDSVFL